VNILIDTNILVYAHDPREIVRHRKSIDLLHELRLRGNGALSTQGLAEFFTATTRPKRSDPPRLSPAEALEQVQLLVASYRVFELTSLIVLEAARCVRDYNLSYFDAQVWATARLNQAPVVISEDFQHQQMLEGVRFINPFVPEFKLADWS
jgi:predicted nucleic acid-binding protein